MAFEFNADYVNTAPPFVGSESALTYLGHYPTGLISPGSAYPGVEPIGNVHPNGNDYQAIANQIAAVSEPATRPQPPLE